MNITIVGGHGKIAMLLHPILKEKGHHIRAIIRNEDQAAELREAGAEPVICDIEKETDLSEAVGNADAVLFAAGAGPGSGAVRKWTVDRDGAIKLIKAAKDLGIRRYLLISAMDLDKPRGDEVFQTYQKAKAEADEILRNSGLDFTIVKPGQLTDDPGTGQVNLAPRVPKGKIPRQDVAAVLAEIIETSELSGYQLELTSGEINIQDAVRNAVKAPVDLT